MLLILPFSIALSQDLGTLQSTADYHYKSYILGNVSGEGNCQIQLYSNGVVIRFYKVGSKEFGNQNVFYYRQQGSYGTLIYVEPSNSSTYNSLEKYTDGRYNMYVNDPTNMFFSHSLLFSFTKGSNNIEYNMWDQPAAPANNNYNSGNNYNTSNNNSQATKCNRCSGDGRCHGYGGTTDYMRLHCGGSGQCSKCYGKGYVQNSYDINQQIRCSSCNGTGKCQQCGGTGRCSKCGGSGH